MPLFDEIQEEIFILIYKLMLFFYLVQVTLVFMVVMRCVNLIEVKFTYHYEILITIVL
jgi:hypothetical protein